MLHVIAYDIPSDRRRSQVSFVLEGFGRRLQYSVFECDLTKERLAELRERTAKILVPSRDRLVVYRVCESCVQHRRSVGRTLSNPETIVL